MRRNTAPCIAYANYKIHGNRTRCKNCCCPFRSFNFNGTRVYQVVEKGFEFVAENNALLTLGIQPSRPETGYGYIQITGEKVQ